MVHCELDNDRTDSSDRTDRTDRALAVTTASERMGMTTHHTVATFTLAVALLSGCTSTPPPTSPLVKVADISVPSDGSRYDYASIDPQRRLLYVAHLGADEALVLDLRDTRNVHVVNGLGSVHGVLAPPHEPIWFATATRTNELVALQVGSNTEQWRINVGSFPDGIGFDRQNTTVAVSNKGDGSVTLARIGSSSSNSSSNRPPAQHTVKLGDETGNVVHDPTGNVFLVAVTPPAKLVALTHTGVVAKTIELHDCKGAHGVVVADRERIALVACERNGSVAVVDLTTAKQVLVLKVGDGPDVLAFDPGLHRAYVAAENGPTIVVDVRPGGATVIGGVSVGPNAHTVAVDPTTHLLYFALHDVNGHAVIRVMRPHDVPAAR